MTGCTQDAASETTSISRTSSYQKLEGDGGGDGSAEGKDLEAETGRMPELNSLSSASFNFINSIIGAGVIGK